MDGATLCTVKKNSASVQVQPPGFDLFRLSKSKASVDVSPNCLRAMNRAGLPFYRHGKCVFISRTELAAFIRARTLAQ